MEPDSIRLLMILFVCVIFSAFFSASETALISLNKIRLRNMLDEQEKGAKAIEKATNNSGKLLSSILVGNNFVNITASSIATLLAVSLSGNNSLVITVTTIGVTVIILIFGEIMPKTLASNHSKAVSAFVAKPINFFIFILTPVVFIINVITGCFFRLLGESNTPAVSSITESELKTMVNVSQEEGLIRVDERRMINNVFEFDESHAKDIMTPRTDMVAIPVEATYSKVMSVFKEEQFSRVPVYKEDTDHIVGILHFRDFIFSNADEESFKIESFMRTPFFSYESKLTSELFLEMRSTSNAIAIILDEYGGTSGIITIEDLVEQIVGELSDEYDEDEDDIEPINETEFVVDGGTKLDDINEELGIQLQSDDYESIGGYVMGLLGDIPNEGAEIQDNGIKFIVEEVDKNRIEKLRVYISLQE